MYTGIRQYREQEEEILNEIFRLIEEQTRALELRACDKVAAQRKERAYRIRDLLQQVSRERHSIPD